MKNFGYYFIGATKQKIAIKYNYTDIRFTLKKTIIFSLISLIFDLAMKMKNA